MADIAFVITNAGRAVLVAAGTAGTLPVTISQVGISATALTAAPTTTSLPSEIKRIGSVGGSSVAADTIHLTARDASSDAYDVRSIGLYLADGTLFAAYGQPSPLMSKSAAAIFFLAADVKFADIAASSITFGNTNFLNPPASETVQGVAEIATQAETNTGADDVRMVTPKKLLAAVTLWVGSWLSDVWRSSNDGAGSGLDADLLDGQQGAYYADIPGRLGYTPANRAGETFTGNSAIQHSAGDVIFSLNAAVERYGYLRLQRGSSVRWAIGMTGVAEGGASTGSDFFINRYADGGVFIDACLSINRSTGELYVRGNRAWHAANDGSGSGLDADTVDGRQASEFALLTGGTFSGAVNAPVFNLAGISSAGWFVSGGNVLIASDVNDYYYFDRVANYHGFGIGGNWQGGVSGSGVWEARVGFSAAGNGVWHAGNDGSGSGLDADLLDGIDSSGFIKASTNVWQFSTDGAPRLHFAPNATTYFGSGSGSGWAWQYLGVDRATLDGAGNLKTKGYVAAEGSGLAEVRPNGDFSSRRAGGASGAYFFGDGTRFLYFDGSVFSLSGGGLVVNGATAWTAGNDGAGSGLDADLLDGQDSSYFADIPARLGYTPANKAGETFIGAVNAPVFNLTGTTGVGYFMSGGSVLLSGDENDYYYFDRGANYHGFGVGGAWQGGVGASGVWEARVGFTAGGSTVWHAANDGSGSGLDADMLDGYHASSFARIVDENMTENGGYTHYASGKKECWGFLDLGQDSFGVFYLPVAHEGWVIPTISAYTPGGETLSQHDTDFESIIYDEFTGKPVGVRFFNSDDRLVRVWVHTIGF